MSPTFLPLHLSSRFCIRSSLSLDATVKFCKTMIQNVSSEFETCGDERQFGGSGRDERESLTWIKEGRRIKSARG